MRLAILLSFAASLGAAPAFAADAPPSPQAGWQRPSPEQMEARRAAMQAERSGDMALLLGLRGDQKPALDAYLAASHGHGHEHGERGRHGPGQPGDTPPAQPEGTIARLDHMSQRIDARDAEAKQHIEATRRFYAALTPDQQKRFDAIEQLMHGHGSREGSGWRGRER